MTLVLRQRWGARAAVTRAGPSLGTPISTQAERWCDQLPGVPRPRWHQRGGTGMRLRPHVPRRDRRRELRGVSSVPLGTGKSFSSPQLLWTCPRLLCLSPGSLCSWSPSSSPSTGDGWKKPLSFLLQKAHVKVKSPDESANQGNLLCLRVSTYLLTFLLMKKMIIKTFWLKEAISGLQDAFLGAGVTPGPLSPRARWDVAQ